MTVQKFELHYADLISKILCKGEKKDCRNGYTKSVFGESIKVDISDGSFPLIQGRKMYPEGILGEFAAFVRGPKHVDDFKKWGCNYWDLWADKDGNLTIDYGNAWIANGQLDWLIKTLKTNPNDRRMIINGWRPERLKYLSLPCCHYSYQFHVNTNGELNMIWNQRSVDMMIGLPADFVLAAIWVIILANEVNLRPGTITMMLGDCHIYDEHLDQAEMYINNVYRYLGNLQMSIPLCELIAPVGTPMIQMEPGWFGILYESMDPIKFLLKE